MIPSLSICGVPNETQLTPSHLPPPPTQGLYEKKKDRRRRKRKGRERKRERGERETKGTRKGQVLRTELGLD